MAHTCHPTVGTTTHCHPTATVGTMTTCHPTADIADTTTPCQRTDPTARHTSDLEFIEPSSEQIASL